MQAPAGWYPDPSGQPGMFRYWNGSSWSADVSPHPHAAPPASASAPPPTSIDALAPSSSKVGWIIGIVVGVLIAAVIAFLALQPRRNDPVPEPDDEPTRLTTPIDPCQTNLPRTMGTPSPDRVKAGRVSIPRLGAPWEPPRREQRIPFALEAWDQISVTESVDARSNWVADVVVAQLLSGDGFVGPKDGSELILKCLQADMYTPGFRTEELVSQAMTVAGRPAWLREAKVYVSKPGLKATYDHVLIVVIDTGTDSAGLFFCSVPNTHPALLTTARETLGKLTVDT